jgi:hypothetical protein
MPDASWEKGIPAESYDPNQLMVDVEHLLRERGLHPDAAGRAGLAVGGAGSLLRAFGILPAGDVRMIDRRNAPDEP